ncbi:MAG: DpnI domain-containing protein, partial [Psychrobacter sp.]
MNLHFNQSLAKNYKSPSQIIRVLSENWVATN